MNPIDLQHSTESNCLPSHLSGLENEIRSLQDCGRLFFSRGWSVGTSSNYSVVTAREPLELLITASGKDKGNLLVTDFVRVGGDGRPVVDDQPQSSAETMLHCVLAQRPDVGAILHTHSVWATLLSDLYFEDDGFVIEDYEMLKGLEGITTHDHQHWIQIFDNTQNISGLADEVEQKLNDPRTSLTHGFLLRQHGLYTWGRDVFAARRHVEIYEFLFECIARKLMLTGIIPIHGIA